MLLLYNIYNLIKETVFPLLLGRAQAHIESYKKSTTSNVILTDKKRAKSY